MSQQPEVFIIAALSADGFIARNSTEIANWTSKEDKARFVALTKEAGVIVMGGNTFRTFKKPLKDRLHIIYSRTEKFEEKWPDGNVETTNLEPTELINSLAKRGYTKIAICGGREIYSKFLSAGVVTKIYLTIEPIVFGSGLTLFNETPLESKHLILDRTEHRASGTIFLDYSVKE